VDQQSLKSYLNLADDPMSSFRNWWQEVNSSGQMEPSACCLSTCDSRGPHSRMVLMRRLSDEGFYFFTNYNSHKSQQIASNPYVALNFHWQLPRHRQVRIEGVAERASDQISDEYFASRPRESQISAWLSPQSSTLTDLDSLVKKRSEVTARFDGMPVPRPDFWGGFLIRPHAIEFWQEENYRFHYRYLFRKEGAGWVTEILAP
jgi:pyridoxamine 5'-phosphate oxidase